jgi:hypothetical protein
MHPAIIDVATRLAAILSLIALLGSFYVFLIRPVQFHWGATPEELARPMPEDNISPIPCSTPPAP